MSYTTQAKVLQRLGYADATDVDLLARVDDAIVAATSQIELDCDRVFTPTDAPVAVAFAAPDQPSNTLRVPDFSTTVGLVVKVDDDDDGVFETTVSDVDAWTISNRTSWPYDHVTLLNRLYPYGNRRARPVQITAQWGWTAVPDPIDQACSLLASRIAQRASAALFGVQSFGEVGAASIRNDDPDYLSLIGPYRRPQVV